MKYKEFYGYLIYENGNILGLNGEKLKDSRRIKLKINNTYQTFTKVRLLYYVFNKDTFDINDLSVVIKIKNKNKKITLDNLVAVSVGDILHGDKHVRAKLTNKQVNEIINIYKKGIKQDEGLDKNNPYRKVSYRKLAEMYGVSHNLIKGIIKGEFRNKNNYIIKED